MRNTVMKNRWRKSSGLTAVLTTAVLEWLLILLLFVHALFSYLLTRLARFWELQTPCLICSRLDHLFGDENDDFYFDLICSKHKQEVSCMVFCHVHNKLAHVHGMCENCLRSSSSFAQDSVQDFSGEKFCSCCNESWTLRLDNHEMMRFESNGSDTPLPDSFEKDHPPLHNEFNSRTEASKQVASSNVGISTFDPLAPIGYTELKITSDSESEVSLSDDDRNSLLHGQNDNREEIRARSIPLEPESVDSEYLPKTLLEDMASGELSHQAWASERSVLFAEAQQVEGESHDLTSSASASVLRHGVEDLNLLYVEEKAGISSEPDLIPPEEVPLSSNVGAALAQDLSISPDVVEHGLEDLILPPVEEKAVTSVEPELVSLRDVPSSSNAGEIIVEEFTQTSAVTGVDVLEPGSCKEIPKSCEVGNGLIMSTGADVRTNELSNDRGPPVTNLMDLSDAYKLVITNKGNEASSMPEQVTVNTRVSGDLKLWLSQISSSRGLELSLSEMSPRVYGTWDDSKMYEASNPMGLQILQKRISLERNMSGFESLDGSIVSEIEGESVVDRLKRQVEYDRKSMNALYKELEEERNASSVAANQALAMITRLQEEKATLQMEALQYLRMMEEQAEYDVDALQKANALLAEKEKEVQDLEVELEKCRKKNSRVSFAEKTQEAISDSKESNMRMDRLDVSRIGYAISTPCNTPREPLFEGREELGRTYMMNGYNNAISEESLAGFEDEKAYISQCLKSVEKKLYLFSNNGVQFPNGEYPEKELNGVDHVRQLHYEEETQGTSQNEDDGLSIRKNLSVHSSAQENGSSSKEHYSSDGGKDQDTHLIVLKQEFSHLNERLKALDADRNFLEHTINSLRTGDGIQFIQEIAQDLRELRRIGIRREQALE